MQLLLVALFLVAGVLVGVFLPDHVRDMVKRETCDSLQKRVAEYCPPPSAPDKPQQ